MPTWKRALLLVGVWTGAQLAGVAALMNGWMQVASQSQKTTVFAVYAAFAAPWIMRAAWRAS
ncbi:hypothetical protein [Aestuariimicrobium ganziense]|uniref:hypothetical protein n=1 Tax=Aestuariimicrobium ganziense TaxID=2773677 RepID=UPI001940790F|nr:hypothetical protein [Aestuariimicrobium ganziense]